jgi:hypothetical protein
LGYKTRIVTEGPSTAVGTSPGLARRMLFSPGHRTLAPCIPALALRHLI